MRELKLIADPIEAFSAVEWVSYDYPLKTDDEDEVVDAGWVKFQIEQTKLGFRTLEFLGWVATDMRNAGERLHFFPTSPPPYLNTPGKSLSFVIEVYPKATVHQLFGAERARRYKRQFNTWRIRAEILESLQNELTFQIWREGCLSNDHCFDALLSAYTGYLWAKHGWTFPQEYCEILEQDGWIWFPPTQ